MKSERDRLAEQHKTELGDAFVFRVVGFLLRRGDQHLGDLVHLPAVGSGRDRGKRDGLDFQQARYLERRVQAVREQLRVGLAAVAVRPNGVNHPRGWQIESRRRDGFAHGQAVGVLSSADLGAGAKELRAGSGMDRAVDGDRLIERRLAGGRAVLGICVGMQIMFDGGNEHGEYTSGLGQWLGEVTRLQAPVVPHMGWSIVAAHPETQLFAGIEDERFYFVHSYAAHEDPAALYGESKTRKPLTSFPTYGERFVAAIENGPLVATQFHPEKSGEAGLTLLANWLQRL